MQLRHTEKWYQRRLAKYFTEHYAKYEETAEFYPDPAINQWKFCIDDRRVVITLTCSEDGTMIDEKEVMK